MKDAYLEELLGNLILHFFNIGGYDDVFGLLSRHRP
jgi:hypothetical protein